MGNINNLNSKLLETWFFHYENHEKNLTLDFSWCQEISDVAIEKLSSGIKSFTGLQKLHWWNWIEISAVQIKENVDLEVLK